MEEEEDIDVPQREQLPWYYRLFLRSSHPYQPVQAESHDLLPRFSPPPPTTLFTPSEGPSKLNSKTILLTTFVTLLSILFITSVAYSRTYSQSNPTRPIPLLTTTDPTIFSPQTWLSNGSNLNVGYIPFAPSSYNPLLQPRQPLIQTPTVSSFSPSCLDQWISSGVLCRALQGKWKNDEGVKVDFVYTWVNGSDPLMSEWRNDASTKFRGTDQTTQGPRGKGAMAAKHFRDHDELRFSIRSILKSFSKKSIGKFHLVVGDTPLYSPLKKEDDSGIHVAQVPQWVDFSTIRFPESDATIKGLEENSLTIHPHSSIFKKHASDDEEVTAEDALRDAEEWRSKAVPSFNSIAIESQLVNIPDMAPNALMLNDDCFILQDLSSSDVTSPIAGPVFRLQRDLWVSSTLPGENKNDPDGEWKGLGEANWVLDRRFGERKRPYLVHIVKSVSVPIWKEARDIFPDVMTLTASSRFRGQSPLEIQSWFFLAHYTIEKHREALLWSFFFGRSDIDQDGIFSRQEQIQLMDYLASFSSHPTSDSSIIYIPAPQRSTMSSLLKNYSFAGLPLPQATDIAFTSHDGFAFFAPDATYALPTRWPSFDKDVPSKPDKNGSVCSIDVIDCFGEDWGLDGRDRKVEDVFKNVSFFHPRCGDCVIIALLGGASAGSEAFLPPASPPPPSPTAASPIEEEEGAIEAVGLSPIFGTASFALPPPSSSSSSIRSRCVNLIQRYAYTIGDSPAEFLSVRSTTSLRLALGKLDQREKLPAFLTINDDLPPRAIGRITDGVEEVYEQWMKKMWPMKSKWESEENIQEILEAVEEVV